MKKFIAIAAIALMDFYQCIDWCWEYYEECYYECEDVQCIDNCGAMFNQCIAICDFCYPDD